MPKNLDYVTGICPTINIDDSERASPVYSEEYEEYVCSLCNGSLSDDPDRAVEQFTNHAIDPVIDEDEIEAEA